MNQTNRQPIDVRALFDGAALDYDRTRPRYIPCFDEFYGFVLELLPFASEEEFSVLDVGAGTGLLSALIARAYPRARFTLLDIAPQMLEVAAGRFAGAGESGRFQFQVCDYIHQPFEGRYDVAVSALSLHHTEPALLPSVFAKIAATLPAGGFFINADQTLGTSPTNEAKISAMWERQARERGATDEEIVVAIERMKADRTATLEEQLKWMREVGFRDVECWYKNWRFAVYSGRVGE